MDECHCPHCDWSGDWDQAEQKKEYQKYGDAFGSPAIKVEYSYFCPDCGVELEEGPLPEEEG